MRPVLKLFISILIPLSVGSIAGIFTASSVKDWFLLLNKPSFNPPSWLFGPVWTILYILMGISFYLIWINNKDVAKKRICYVYYWIQLLLNFLWSFLFFFFKNPGLALIDIVVLLTTIVLTTVSFNKISTVAARLLIPYILWVSFATALNFEIWRLN